MWLHGARKLGRARTEHYTKADMSEHRATGLPVERSKLGFSRLVLGTWPMGGLDWGQVEERASIETIHAAIAAGTTTIDTSPAYGFGDCERLVGRALLGRRDDVVLASKFGLVWGDEEGSQPWQRVDQHGRKITTRKNARSESVQRQCEQSLQRLQTDYIDLYQLHWPDPATPIEATMEGLLRLRAQGKIRAIGLCNVDSQVLRRAVQVGPVDTIQAPYSLLNREIERELMPLCRERGVALWAYWTLERGLLSDRAQPGSVFPRGDHRRWDHRFCRRNRQRVQEALAAAQQREDLASLNLAQLALAWVLNAEGVDAALVGATTPTEAQSNADALALRLNPEQWEWLAECFAPSAQAMAGRSLGKQWYRVIQWVLAKSAILRAR